MSWAGARGTRRCPASAYILFGDGKAAISALTPLPDDARQMGAKPSWVGYVGVDDVDATAAAVTRLGGAVHVPPTDASDISRFSVFTDPQTARLALFKWRNPGQQPPAAPDAPGRVGWHELLAADWEQAWAFYGELFGWQKADAEISETGTYQLFSAGGQMIGGMFTKPATIPAPFWLYYFNIGDIDATAQRVKAGGGQILEGPIETAGGSWIDPMHGPAGCRIRAGGNAEKPPGRIFRARRTPILPAREPGDGPGRADARSVGSRRWRAATKRELTDRTLNVEFDPGHFGEQIDIGAPDRASAKSHVGRHQIERLNQYAGVLQDERIGERAVFPGDPAEARRDGDDDLRRGGRAHG